MSPRPLSPTIRERLAKLLPRLATPHDGRVLDGERIATIGAIDRTFANEGLDWHDLTSALTSELPVQSPGRPPPPQRAPADPSDPLIGRRIRLDRACRECHSHAAVLHPGRGPHAYALKCATCGHHSGWLPHARAAALRREMWAAHE